MFRQPCQYLHLESIAKKYVLKMPYCAWLLLFGVWETIFWQTVVYQGNSYKKSGIVSKYQSGTWSQSYCVGNLKQEDQIMPLRCMAYRPIS